jgi:hypothetical protein
MNKMDWMRCGRIAAALFLWLPTSAPLYAAETRIFVPEGLPLRLPYVLFADADLASEGDVKDVSNDGRGVWSSRPGCPARG